MRIYKGCVTNAVLVDVGPLGYVEQSLIFNGPQMNLRTCFYLALTLSVYSAAYRIEAEQPATDFEPEAISVWVPYSDTRVFSTDNDWGTQRLSDGTVLEVGDPKVGQWAERITPKASRMSPKDMEAWIRLVGHYRLTKAKPMLTKAATKLVKQQPHEWGQQRNLFRALAHTAEKRDIKTLRRLLDARIQGNPSKLILIQVEQTKQLLAAALVQLGDPVGRDYLVSEYQKNLILYHTKNESYHGEISYILETLYDPQLVEQVAGLADHEDLKDNTKAKQTINKLVAMMKINGLPLDQLREIVKGRIELEDEMRIQALHALAERGMLSDLKLIEGVLEDYVKGTRKGGYSKRQYQLATTAMRCRLWKKID